MSAARLFVSAVLFVEDIHANVHLLIREYSQSQFPADIAMIFIAMGNVIFMEVHHKVMTTKKKKRNAPMDNAMVIPAHAAPFVEVPANLLLALSARESIATPYTMTAMM